MTSPSNENGEQTCPPQMALSPIPHLLYGGRVDPVKLGLPKILIKAQFLKAKYYLAIQLLKIQFLRSLAVLI